MNVRLLGDLLREEVTSTAIPAPERSGLHASAQDNLTMVHAYLTDGDTFLKSDDPVNALAAYCYGEGWLHCGAACGFLRIGIPQCLCNHTSGRLPHTASGKLEEKTMRYERLLAAARAAVRPAPEAGSALHLIAERVAIVAGVYARLGRRSRDQGNFESALAFFSYGHGWLDAGVRGGLFIVLSDRDLFTI